MQRSFYDSYEESDANQYEEALVHLVKINEERALELLRWLLRIPRHRTIDNYLLASEFLKKRNQIAAAEQLIGEGIVANPGAVELEVQRTHLRVLSSKTQAVGASRGFDIYSE